ncbi:MAG: hypothetical protein IJE02_01275 [Clostridia bacterium]|nr:hypothetical protein [Clostridia bacterium]
MTNLFKNNKVLAFVLAFAVLAVSLFTGVAVSHIHADAANDATQTTAEGNVDLLEFGDYLINDLGSTSKWYDNKLADNGETGDSWENAIIIDSAEELVYLCKASGDDTKGKYYKVADGIAGFNLANANLDLDGTLADNLDVVKGSGKNHAGGTPGFQGHFDGNGATVYGAWTNHTEGNISGYAGLFSCTKGEVTIKNIHVNKACFTATTAVGGIIGFHNATEMCTVTVENCSVTDSYFEVKNTGYGVGVGAIIGRGDSAPALREVNDQKDYNGDGDMTDTIYINVAYNVKNCYVNLDEANFVSKAEDGTVDANERACHGGVAGFMASNALAVSDCVVIGVKPYAVMEGTAANDVQHSGLESHFTNVYTTENVQIEGVDLGGAGALANRNFTGKVFPLADAQLKGAAAAENMDLDWSVWMADANGYPELANAHKNITLVDKEDGTHAATCACGFGGIAVEHNFVDGTCACGAELNCASRKTITWDGSVATGIATGAGTKDNPYVIKSAAELAWLVQQKADVTTDKYYEIDPAIGAIVLQSADKVDAIKALDSAAATKAYFEAGTFTPWKTVGWEGSCFAGHFDGNGVTIYGLYAKSINNAALFSTVDGGSAIRNIAVKNSYFTSSGGNYQVGALIGTSSNPGYGAKRQGIIWVSDVVIANNYMYNNAANPSNGNVEVNRSGIIGGVQEAMHVENCLVYGNDATYNDGYKMPLVANAANAIVPAATHYDGFEPKISVNETTGETFYYNVVRNTVVLGADIMNTKDGRGWRKNDPECYKNCYTDGASGTVALSNGEWTYTEEQIKAITAADIATVELGSAWLNTATYPELKTFHDAEFTAVIDNGDGTHSATCSCGVAFKPEAHNIVEGECTVCDFACAHAETEFVEKNGADCTNDAIGDKVCKVCGKVLEENVAQDNTALGHDLKEVKGTDAKCDEPGVKTYYDCSRCDFVSEDAEGETPITDLETWKVIPEKGHTPVTDNGEIVYTHTAENHSKTCSVCNKEFDTQVHAGSIEPNGADGHAFECSICLRKETNAPHTFGDDNVCDTCNWTCTAHDFVEGDVAVEGDCITNKEVSTYCSICGIAGENNVTTAPGHNFNDFEEDAADCVTEGVKAHKWCDVCEKNFAADEADKYSTNYVLDSDLVIPVDPNAHDWQDIEATDPTCEEPGCIAHKLCGNCLLAIVDGEEIQLELDIEAINPENFESEEEWLAAVKEAVYAAYDEAGILVAAGHTLTEVKEVAATADKEGTKAHYACSECDKTFADAEGKTEVTADELVIEKLGGGDEGDKAPVTGESVAMAAAVVALMGAAFVIIRKARKA